jgi:hypothetical protein
MTVLTETELEKAIAQVRNPHRTETDRDRMDTFELGARRLLAYLQRNGYTITK